MRTETLQIVWHNLEPVFSVCFHPSGKIATAGADKMIRIWQMETESTLSCKFLACLKGHATGINVVRFSPSGEILASAGDDGTIHLWRLTDERPVAQEGFQAEEEDEQKYAEETWKCIKTLSGHTQDVYDLSWSPSGEYLVSGSVDHSMFIWSLNNPYRMFLANNFHLIAAKYQSFRDHKNFVQGVSWDPLDEFVVSQSCDRMVKIYHRPKPVTNKKKTTTEQAEKSVPVSTSTKPKDFKLLTTVMRRKYFETKLPIDSKKTSVEVDENMMENQELQSDPLVKNEKSIPQSHLLFMDDESVSTYFRRLDWSPDGLLLALPTGMWQDPPIMKDSNELNPAQSNVMAPKSKKAEHALYLFHRGDFNSPMMRYSGFATPALIVRFSPILYSLMPGTPKLMSSPYRMIFAVATSSTVLIFDTQHKHPIVMLKNLHAAPLTDLSWSADGLKLAISSQDGYCSFAVFEPSELGIPLDKKDAEFPLYLNPAVKIPIVSILPKLLGQKSANLDEIIPDSIINNEDKVESAMDIEPDFSFNNNTEEVQAVNLMTDKEPDFSFSMNTEQPEIPTLLVKRKVVPAIVPAQSSEVATVEALKSISAVVPVAPSSASKQTKSRIITPILISN